MLSFSCKYGKKRNNFYEWAVRKTRASVGDLVYNEPIGNTSKQHHVAKSIAKKENKVQPIKLTQKYSNIDDHISHECKSTV